MFGHLQIYSCYSFQKSTVLINDLVKDAKEKNITHLALTDKNNMYGMLQFNDECLKNNITPLFGLEADVMIDDEIYPFVLLAKDDLGYFALVKISSYIYLNEQNSVSLEFVRQYIPHIYVISACQDGLIERLVVKEMEEQAEMYMRQFKQLFQENYYIMIQNHGLEMQKHFNQRLM